MKRIEKDTRRFLVINTTEYNGDGRYAVSDVEYNELKGMGFDEEELKSIDELFVGDRLGVSKKDVDREQLELNAFMFIGVYVMRVA